MNKSNVVVRNADFEDIRPIVRIHMEAFERFFLTCLGPAFLRTFYTTLVEDHFSLAFVSESRDGLTGFALGASESKGMHSRLMRRRWLRMGLAASPALIRRPAAVMRIAKMFHAQKSKASEVSTKRNRALLMSFAVDPRAQKLGHGRQLIDAFCNKCKEVGCSAVELTTDARDNDTVRAFYERNGFAVEELFEAHGGRQMLRYVRNLVE